MGFNSFFAKDFYRSTIKKKKDMLVAKDVKRFIFGIENDTDLNLNIQKLTLNLGIEKTLSISPGE